MFDVNEREERILKFWEDQDIFRKSMQAREGAEPFVFFEGPPTANAAPAIHHFIGRVFKDLFGRYQTMRGRYVLRKGGWDTHGLPVELQIEKKLGFTSKKDIEAYGIAAFNKLCRQSVWEFKTEWDHFTKRSGYWVDLKDPYITYETPYVESLWAIIKKIDQKKLLYQAHRVVPFCTRCGTPLSNHEVAQGYKTVTDTSVYLKFKVAKAPAKLKLPKNTFILAWTTTPWTLPGNVALAVGPSISYVLARRNQEYFIIAEELANKVLGAPLAIERTLTGKDLLGISYEPLFSVRALKKPKSYKVYPADFVTTTDGTGVVHTAVMYGEDDYNLGTKLGLPKVHTVTEQGVFTGVSNELDGMYVKANKTEAAILAHLEDKGTLLSKVPYEHEYPFCWRCDTPLLYYAKDSWFIATSKLNRQMLANNNTINWVPSHLKEGRFGQWLREGRDWAFSRERYWGTPLPVWQSGDKKTQLVVGSLDELDTYRARKPNTYWLVRHGESVHNVAGVIDDGKGASDLTSRGRAQAVEVAKSLKKKFGTRKPAAFLYSPIARCKETAAIIASALGVKNAKAEPLLEEIHLGPSLEGCHDTKYHTQYPTYHDKFTQTPPGGESLADLKARLWGLLRELDAQHEGKDIVLVSHEYPIWMMTSAANGWTMEETIAEKERRDATSERYDFIVFAGVEKVAVRNLPRDDRGDVDPHRPYIDQVALKKGGKVLMRIPELCDVWFDSGAMPYAQWHWPFAGSGQFKTQYPADFISEGIDQTRGWFYTLLAVSTLLGNGAPYKNVLSYSHVLDEKGAKMSKSKGNIVKPADVIDAVGVDTARWYFYTVNNPGDPKMFSMREVRERLTGFMGTLSNCVRFYELYRSEGAVGEAQPKTELDRWILSRLANTTREVTDHLDGYDLTTASRAIETFVVDDFSQWWLRRSRKRRDALGMLQHLLHSIALLSAPFVPFIAEDVWLKVREKKDALSVHLADWPAAGPVNDELEVQMSQLREYITAGLAIRKDAGIKVRQPLASATVPGKRLHDDLEGLIKEELNVKAVRYVPGEPVSLDIAISPALRAEGWAREVIRAIQEMRKEAGLQMGQKAHGQWYSDDKEVSDAILAHIGTIISETSMTQFVCQPEQHTPTVQRTFDLAVGKSIRIGIAK